MSFATFAILVFALVMLVLIASRRASSSSPSSSMTGQPPLSPPVGPPCPNCGQPRGHVDRYCRRCGLQLLPASESYQTPPAQQQ
jgi:predicted amidophosphoribosyltransferase